MDRRNHRNIKAKQNGRYQHIGDSGNLNGNSEIGKSLTLSSQIQSELFTDFGMSLDNIQIILYSKIKQNRGPRWDTYNQLYKAGLLFHLLQTVDHFTHGLNNTKIKKYTLQEVIIPYQKKISVQAGEILLEI